MKTPPLLLAARKQPAPFTPVWLMRQAGRYLREYRRLRERYPFLTLCKDPELVVEVTLLPLKKFELDGAIVFSDLLLPLEGMGLKIAYPDGGPRVLTPVRDEGDVENLSEERALEALQPVIEAIRVLRREVPADVALIGFAGGPFTMACYAIEGRGSKDFPETKAMMRRAPEVFDRLMGKLSGVIRRFLLDQAKAGCHIVQVFDSWAGSLSPLEYRRRVLPFVKEAIRGMEIPVIYFSTGTGGFIELIAEAGGEVIGLDWRVDIGEAWRRIGYRRAIQGNLDPSVLLAPRDVIEEEVREILRATSGHPGHIFNLGHGILPDTPEENVAFLVDLVHALTEGRR